MFSPDIITLATQVLDAARARGLHLATAESCTGGLIMAALTEIAGSSDVVDRAFVTYTNRAKREMLGVPGDVIRQQGAVSEACARAMATGGLKASAASLTLSVTGIAGPGGGSEDKPVGLVHMACAARDGTVLHEKQLFGDVGRDQVREATVVAGLRLFMRAMG
ncbi:CinA family protein [Paremcibacter congregatus]|uniref:CinA family protein n=1 Tax=Paremcibacter congregatus TaxID=2043170 RepID=UPI0030EF2BFA|tara:strand:- start:9570 stop:10061 length:492 start_codon:yes stop_codon:yes gene_type:complete